ncbi:MAG: transaldolase [Pseudomonadota bacterium]
MNALQQLREMTTVVADTGDIEAIKAHRPVDATTNPSLILGTAQMSAYRPRLEATVADCHARGERSLKAIADQLFVDLGVEILGHIPGRVSTEIDATLSFDTTACVDRALQIVERYQRAGVDTDRLLIKLASTWEGIRAAELLERQGIHCNMTLLFGMPQALACADAGITLISPFVGRITDWHKARDGVDGYPAAEDPGVQSVRRIYEYYKHFGYDTEVMAASFRTADQVLALAGCDLLTISPALLAELEERQTDIEQQLSVEGARDASLNRIEPQGHSDFLWQLNDDAMACEKLAEGIRRFGQDQAKLEQFISTLL